LTYFIPGSSISLLKSDKVEGFEVEASLMSEKDSLYLESVGLLGEYSRTTRRRDKLLLSVRSFASAQIQPSSLQGPAATLASESGHN
jgi:hypothetical protein